MKAKRTPSQAQPGNCRACGRAFQAHDGLQRTCERVQEMDRTLRVLWTWAFFDRGQHLTRESVLKLLAPGLGKPEPNLVACDTCRGQGETKLPTGALTTCRTCGGTGKLLKP